MARKLDHGGCLAVDQEGELDPAESRGAKVFRLRRFVDDVDYCIAQTEEWIWSIGRRRSDGAILASTDSRYYSNPEFECLFLR